MRIFPPLLALTALIGAPGAQAADQPAGFWTTPTIHGYGRIHYLPDAAYRPRVEETYRIVFSVTHDAGSPAKLAQAAMHDRQAAVCHRPSTRTRATRGSRARPTGPTPAQDDGESASSACSGTSNAT